METSKVKTLYDDIVAENLIMHQHIFKKVFGESEYIGQYSDNSATEILSFGKLMDLPSESNVLDIGCGTGSVAFFLSKNLDWNITGIDISEKSYLMALNKASNYSRLNFVCGDIYTFESETNFDGVYGSGSFCHFEPELLFDKASKLLKPNGKIGFMERIKLSEDISEQEMKNLTTDWFCPGVYSIDEYKQLLSVHFTNVQVLDLTENVKKWHRLSVEVREEMKDFIVKNTSEEYYKNSLDLARYEADVCASDKLGYAAFVATKK